MGGTAIYTVRLIIDSLIALMLVGILASIMVYHREQQKLASRYQTVHRALARLHEQVVIHGALIENETGTGGYPANISPTWFSSAATSLDPHSDLPMNVMVPSRQPWVDVAPPGDLSDHPPDPIISRPDQAGFWYNPNRGLFRARVMPQFSEQETLRVYNMVNGTTLASLPRSGDTARRPTPVPWPGLASNKTNHGEGADRNMPSPQATLISTTPERQPW